MRTALSVMIGIFLLVAVGSADVYRWVDPDGTIHLTSIRPEWWTDELDLVEDWHEIHPPSEDELAALEAARAAERAAEVSEEDAEFVGDRRTMIYHRKDCRLVKSRSARRSYKIDEEDRVFFLTADDAEEEGFRPCRRCKPERM